MSFLTPKELHDERAAICKQCEFLTATKFCSKCGCFIPAKTYIRSTTCVMKKWPVLETKNA